MSEPIYKYVKGQGWVACYTQERRKQPPWDADYDLYICNGCGQSYGRHFGTILALNARCPTPEGRPPTSDDKDTPRFC